jgi:DNA-directed RNA polymerase specialized sigma24 family protein
LNEPRLQRAPELRIVTRQELAAFEHRREAEHLARLEADQELINALQWAKFEGPGWQEMAMALAEYGLAVMTAWLTTGAIVNKCREKHLHGVEVLPEEGLRPDDVDELANLVVGEALSSFRERVLKRGKWSSRKGASLKTYFVGHCCIRFIDVYRHWRTEEGDTPGARHRASAFVRDPTSATAHRQGLSPEAEFIRTFEFDRLTSTICDPVTRQIFILKAQDYSEVAIAEALEMTLGAVKSRMYAYRKNLRKASGDDS